MCFSFVFGLEQVAATIAQLPSGEPARAAWLYETFLAGLPVGQFIAQHAGPIWLHQNEIGSP
jgi:hypothetical protein